MSGLVVIDQDALRAMLADVVQVAIRDALARERGTPEDADGLMTREEMAALLRVSPRDLRRMELEGAIPSGIRIGRRVRWRKKTVEAFISKLDQKALDALRGKRLHVLRMDDHTADREGRG